jgi:hypothetical protein
MSVEDVHIDFDVVIQDLRHEYLRWIWISDRYADVGRDRMYRSTPRGYQKPLYVWMDGPRCVDRHLHSSLLFFSSPRPPNSLTSSLYSLERKRRATLSSRLAPLSTLTLLSILQYSTVHSGLDPSIYTLLPQSTKTKPNKSPKKFCSDIPSFPNTQFSRLDTKTSYAQPHP